MVDIALHVILREMIDCTDAVTCLVLSISEKYGHGVRCQVWFLTRNNLNTSNTFGSCVVVSAIGFV